MYEFTLGGTWFCWSALDRKSKFFAGFSFALSVPTGLFFGDLLKPCHEILGFPVGQHASFSAIAFILCALGTGWFWHLFSLRQDEMFNRVQDRALALASGWTCAIGLAWECLAQARLLPPTRIEIMVYIFAVFTWLFWIQGVRKWVS